MSLAVHPCRTLCSWSARPAPTTDLFACAGCGSEWTPAERWTPRQADGTVPPAVLAARRAGEGDVSGASGAVAGSAGTTRTTGS